MNPRILLQASALIVSGGFVLALTASAHDTNTTHPQITNAAGLAIAKQDLFEGTYAELYYKAAPAAPETARLYWGDNVRLTEAEARTDTIEPFRRTPLNVIDGSVMEDDPFTRVISHFYHGYNGAMLLLAGVPIGAGHPSAVEGFRYFDQAVEVFDSLDSGLVGQGADGTTAPVDSGKALGYWLLGHSLHHVEDMASIAHVHNDSHMPTLPYTSIDINSIDVFEAQYVPTLLWDNLVTDGQYGTIGRNMLDNMAKGAPVNVQNLDAVWGPPRWEATMILNSAGALFGDSLSRATYNLSVFQGVLDRPTWFPGNPPLSADCPQGELAEMLNGASAGSCGPGMVLWYPGSNYWVIQGVGKWYYMNGGMFTNSWWAVSPGYQSLGAFVGPAVLESQRTEYPNGQKVAGSYFYIEDLALPNEHRGAALEPSDLFVPPGIRRTFWRPWDRANNPVVPNTTNVPITEFISASIMPHGAAYVAGVAKFWYDVANPPPYLKRVTARQDDKLIYDGTWKDVPAVRNITLTNKTFQITDATRPFAYAKRRELARTTTGRFINPRRPFEIELEFSEPIQDPAANPTSDKFEVYLSGTRLDHSLYSVTDMRPNEPQAWMKSRLFLLRFNTPLPNLINLDGRVKLGVRAFDRNFHFVFQGPSKYGAVVDGDPSTPAHRQRVHAAQPRVPFLNEREQWRDYLWHTSDSVDVNYPDVPRGGFAYDETAGRDETQYLPFDSSSATAVVSITLKDYF